MGSLNLNGIDFDKELAASLTEAAFIELMSGIAAEAWYKDSEEDRIARLKVAHKLIMDDYSSRNVTPLSEGGLNGDNGGSGDEQPGSDTRPQQRTTRKRGGQEGGEAEQVPEQ